ncbi:RNA polymerase sigma factor [Butyricimonas paravirosa]|mgnify:CR=1|uniref:RNA polymerase sigma factor n=1 Tax=Butyricimonas paravirosa TaxID=1472417 RepID=UPI0021093FE3|nr:RNA polymerase sigma-70 factor [Butyricimonas paravirosa]MCQ4875320.1 RNA polymerase sigma-70 factor [Butyricimonas paravirosa]
MIPTIDIERIKKDDYIHFEHIYNLYSKELYVFACRIVGDKGMAEDIVQDFFVKLWTNRYEINMEGSFRSYCYTSVRNAGINILRTKFRHIELSEGLVAPVDIEFEMERAELRKKLEQTIDLLPERCRALFIDICMDGNSYAATADKYGLSVNTVKVQMSKAYRILREHLSEEQLFLLFLSCLGLKL